MIPAQLTLSLNEKLRKQSSDEQEIKVELEQQSEQNKDAQVELQTEVKEEPVFEMENPN